MESSKSDEALTGPVPEAVERGIELLKKTVPILLTRVAGQLEGEDFARLLGSEKRHQVWKTAFESSENFRTPGGVLLTRREREFVADSICDEILGWGPLQPLMDDKRVTEIMVNGPDDIFIERNGTIEKAPIRFISEDQILRLIQRIVAPLGRRIDMSSPMVDARLPDGSRVNAVINPISTRGPLMTIRRFREQSLSIEDLLDHGALTEPMAAFLMLAVEARLNVIVSGGTGAGKTTLLNVLAGMASKSERIVTVEDSAELQVHKTHPNVCSLEARLANVEGRGAIAIRELVRNALRMRPDRVIVGEVRGAEALDMLHAMNTGHDGSFATLHANSARDVFSRLETMICMTAPEIPLQAVRDLIASAIHLVVHVSRLRDGNRKVVEIAEVSGADVSGRISLRPLWVYRNHGSDDHGKLIGLYYFTGLPPLTRDRLESHGIELPEQLTYKEQKKKPESPASVDDAETHTVERRGVERRRRNLTVAYDRRSGFDRRQHAERRAEGGGWSGRRGRMETSHLAGLLKEEGLGKLLNCRRGNLLEER